MAGYRSAADALRISALITLSLLLPACGGGGGGNASIPDRFLMTSVNYYPSKAVNGILRTDLQTGTSTLLTGSGLLGQTPRHLAFDAVSDTLLTVSELGLFRIRVTDGQLTQGPALAGTLANAGLMTYNPVSKRLLTIVGSLLHSINPGTGAATQVSATPISYPISGIAYDRNADVIYAITNATTPPLSPPIPGKFLKIDPATAAVTEAGVNNFFGLGDLAFDSTTNTLYAVNSGLNQLYSLALSDGTPTLKGTSILVNGLEFDTTRGVLWGFESGAARLSSINPATGAATPSWNTGYRLTALAADASGAVLYGLDATKSALVVVDRATGTASLIGTVADSGGTPFTQIDDLAMGGATLYGFNRGTAQLVTINRVTGVGTALGASGAAVQIVGLGFSGATLYGINSSGPTLVTISTATGAITTGPTLSVTGLHDLAADGAGQLHALDNLRNLYTINTSTGVVTLVGPTGAGNPYGLAYDASASTFWTSDGSAYCMMKLDPLTGAAEAVGSFGFWQLSSMASDRSPGGKLYGTLSSSNFLLTIDRNTGAGRVIAKLAGSQITSMTVQPVAARLLACDGTTLAAIDPATAVRTPIGSIGYSVSALAFNEATGQLFGRDSGGGQLLLIDVGTGAGTVVGPLGVSLTALAYAPEQQRLLGFNGTQVFAIDLSTGAATLQSTLSAIGAPLSFP